MVNKHGSAHTTLKKRIHRQLPSPPAPCEGSRAHCSRCKCCMHKQVTPSHILHTRSPMPRHARLAGPTPPAGRAQPQRCPPPQQCTRACNCVSVSFFFSRCRPMCSLVCSHAQWQPCNRAQCSAPHPCGVPAPACGTNTSTSPDSTPHTCPRSDDRGTSQAVMVSEAQQAYLDGMRHPNTMSCCGRA